MRAIRVAPVALLATAGLTLMAPVAAAQTVLGGTSTSFTPTISPKSVAPGGKVTLGALGCTTQATAMSGVFDTTTIPAGRSATATVDWDAKRGAVYEVTFRCGNVTRTADLTITRVTSSPTISSTAIAPSGVLGGLGGSAGTMDPAEIAAGTALVLAAATGTVLALRRRRDKRLH